MERPKVTQRFLNALERPTDMPNIPWVQWRVENVEEMVRFIEENVTEPFQVRCRFTRIPGDQLLIETPVVNSALQLSPGDCLVLHEQNGRPRLGIVRARNSVQFREADGLRDHNNPEFMDPKDKVISH